MISLKVGKEQTIKILKNPWLTIHYSTDQHTPLNVHPDWRLNWMHFLVPEEKEVKGFWLGGLFSTYWCLALSLPPCLGEMAYVSWGWNFCGVCVLLAGRLSGVSSGTSGKGSNKGYIVLFGILIVCFEETPFKAP